MVINVSSGLAFVPMARFPVYCATKAGIHSWTMSLRWQLRETRGSTFLTLIHGGWSDDELAEQMRQEWPVHLVELKRILELGPAWQPMKVA